MAFPCDLDFLTAWQPQGPPTSYTEVQRFQEMSQRLHGLLLSTPKSPMKACSQISSKSAEDSEAVSFNCYF